MMIGSSRLPELPEGLSQKANRKANTKGVFIFLQGDHLQRTSASQPNSQTPNEYTRIEIAFIYVLTTLTVGCGSVGTYSK